MWFLLNTIGLFVYNLIMLNQEILQFLKENKDKSSKDILVRELKKAGYADEEIIKGVIEVYRGQRNVKSNSISLESVVKSGVVIFIFFSIIKFVFGLLGLGIVGGDNIFSIIAFAMYPAMIALIVYIFTFYWMRGYAKNNYTKFPWSVALVLYFISFLFITTAWFFYPYFIFSLLSNIDSNTGFAAIYIWASGIYYIPIIIGLFSIIPSVLFYKIFKAKTTKLSEIFNKISSISFWLSMFAILLIVLVVMVTI